MSTGDPNYRREPAGTVDDDVVGWGWWWWLVIWIILIIIFFGGGWWWGNWYGGRYGGYQAPPPPNNGGQENVTQGPMIWEGLVDRTMTTQGTVDQTFQGLPQAFTLAPVGSDGRPLLVIANSKSASQAAVKQGQKIVVTGVVHRFLRADVARQTGLNLPANEFDPWGGRLYVLATRVEPAK